MSAETVAISDTSAMPGIKDGVSTRAAAESDVVKKKVVTIVAPPPKGFRAIQGVKITPWKPDMSKCKACEVKFTIFNHRHKCRNCQEPVCNSCSRSRKVLRKYTPPKRICDTCINKFWALKPEKPTSATTTTTTPASSEKPSDDGGFPLTISPDEGECPTDAERTAPMSPGTPAGFFMSPHHRNNNSSAASKSDQVKQQAAHHFRHKSKAVLDLTALAAPMASPIGLMDPSPAAPMLPPPTPAGPDVANMVGTPSSARGWGAFFGGNDNGSGSGSGSSRVEETAAGVTSEETMVVGEAIAKEEQEGAVSCALDGGEGVLAGLAEKLEADEREARAALLAVVVEEVVGIEENSARAEEEVVVAVEELSTQAVHEIMEDEEDFVEIVPIAAIIAREDGAGDVAEDVNVDEDESVGLPLLLENERESSDYEAAFQVPGVGQLHVDATGDVLLASWPSPLPAVPEEPASEIKEEDEQDEYEHEEEDEYEEEDEEDEYENYEKRRGLIILPFVTGLGWSLVAVGTGLAIAAILRLW